MTPGQKACIVLLVASLGLWGCAQGPTNGAARIERIRALEAQVAKLEQDYRTAAELRDQLRGQLAEAEGLQARLTKELRTLERANDSLEKKLAARSRERDVLQSQYDQFRQELRDLLGKAEVAACGWPACVLAARP